MKIKRLHLLTNMEAKLAAYRQQKENEKRAEQSVTNRFKLFLNNEQKKLQNSGCQYRTEDDSDSGDNDLEEDTNGQPLTLRGNVNPQIENSEQQQFKSESVSADTSEVSKWALRVLKLLLWFCLWGLFIELQFGAVFFSISLLLFVYFNTRTGPKDDKLSAYSVFNKDCERIQGTLTAEQLQKNMFSIPGLPS